MAILQGAKRMLGERRIRCIQWEYGGCNLDSRALLLDFFQLLGGQFHIHAILPGGLIPLPEYDAVFENFMTTNYLAVQK